MSRKYTKYVVESEGVFKRNFKEKLMGAYQIFSDKQFIVSPEESVSGNQKTTENGSNICPCIGRQAEKGRNH